MHSGDPSMSLGQCSWIIFLVLSLSAYIVKSHPALRSKAPPAFGQISQLPVWPKAGSTLRRHRHSREADSDPGTKPRGINSCGCASANTVSVGLCCADRCLDDHRSISPNTISCVPIMATTSESMCPRAISSNDARWAKPGARTFKR